MELTQKAFALATAIRVDPFAIERQLPTTPEVNIPIFQKHAFTRKALVAKTILGHGQV